MTEDRRHKPDATRLEQLYHRAADAEPDRRIDETVLGKARMAASRPRRGALRHPGAWGAGLAAAASLVLAVGLVFQYGWQPTPESERLKQFRARAKMEQADKPSAPAAGDSIKRQDAEVPAPIEESAGMDRVQVTGARTRKEADGEGRESQKAEADEARMAAPVPMEEGEQLSPEAWLERIRMLIQDDRRERAKEELRSFKTSYPSTNIPSEIRDMLDEPQS